MRDVAELSGGSYVSLVRLLATRGSLGAMVPWDTTNAGKKPKTAMFDGCEWFRDCELCNFGDCVAGSRTLMAYDTPGVVMSYASPESKRLRAWALACGLESGAEMDEIAEFFGWTETEKRTLKTMADSMGSQLLRLEAHEVRRKAVRARMRGEPEVIVAGRFRVHPRTVRNWCAGVDGIKRGNGNAARAMVAAGGHDVIHNR